MELRRTRRCQSEEAKKGKRLVDIRGAEVAVQANTTTSGNRNAWWTNSFEGN